MFSIWVAVVNAKEWITKLTQEERKRFYKCGVAGLDVRWGYPVTGPSENELKVMEEARQAGLRIRTHGWTGRVDGKPSSVGRSQGGFDGDKTGFHVVKHGSEMHSANHEKGVWWAGDRKWNQGANDYLEEWAAAMLMRRACPGELGFADPAWHYPGAKVAANAKKHYRRKHAMAYQSAWKGITDSIARARKVWPGMPLSAWLGVGRIDSSGNVVGSADVTRRVVAERPSGIDEVVFYVGNGAWSQVIKGHDRHPPLVQLIPELLDGRC